MMDRKPYLLLAHYLVVALVPLILTIVLFGYFQGNVASYQVSLVSHRTAPICRFDRIPTNSAAICLSSAISTTATKPRLTTPLSAKARARNLWDEEAQRELSASQLPNPRKEQSR